MTVLNCGMCIGAKFMNSYIMKIANPLFMGTEETQPGILTETSDRADEVGTDFFLKRINVSVKWSHFEEKKEKRTVDYWMKSR